MWYMVASQAAQTIFNTRAQNKLAEAQNKVLAQQTAKQLNDIAIQRAMSRDRTETALFNIKQGQLQAQSQVGLQAAASGTMGASVRDAVSTVNVIADRQESSVRQQQASQEAGFELLTNKIMDTAVSQFTPKESVLTNLIVSQGALLGKFVGNKLSEEMKADAEPSEDTVGDMFKNFGYDLWGAKGSTDKNSWY